MRRLCVVVSLFALALPARAIDADALDKVLAPYVNEETFGAVLLDTDRLDVAALLKRFGELTGEDEKKIDAVRKAVQPLADLVKKQTRGVVLINGLDVNTADHTTILVMLDKDADAKVLTALLNVKGMFEPFRFEQRGDLLVGASETGFKRLKQMKASPRPELARALTGSEGLVRLVISPSPILRRAFEEGFPDLPKEVGGGSIRIATEGIRIVTLSFDSPPKTKVELTLHAADATSARALANLFAKILGAVKGLKELKEELPGVEMFIALLKPEAAGDKVTLKITEEDLKPFTAAAVARIKDNAVQKQLTNNLRQIGLALHNFHDATGSLPPPAILSKKKEKLLSWRVHMLPYLEEQALYQQFKMDEPWDSEHNKQLIKKMPKVFASVANPKLAEEGKTPFVVAVGKDTMFPGTKGVKLREIADGTSNTIMVAEADDANAVIWTKPDDLTFDPKEPARGLRVHGDRGFLVLFGDGSVRFIRKTIDKDMLKALFTRNGGEVVNID